MARLIVDDAGARKAFRLPKGRLTVGSGEGVTLRLSAPGVVDRHLEILVTDASTSVRVAPGAPKVALGNRTVAAGASAEWTVGETLTVGGATVLLEGSAAAPASAAAAPAVAPAVARTPTRAGTATGTAAGTAARASRGSASGARGRSGGGARRRAAKGEVDADGRPKWLVPAIGVVFVVGVLGFYFMFIATRDRGQYYATDVIAIRTHLENQRYGNARVLFDPLAASTRLDESQRAAIADLQRQIEEGEALQSGGGVMVTRGHAWSNRHLEKMIAESFAAPPYDPAAVRILDERIRDFKKIFPGHAATAELDAVLARVGAAAIVGQPLTHADVEEYERYFVTRVKSPKRFPRALAAFDTFLAASPSAEDREVATAKAAALREAQRAETLRLIAAAKAAWAEENERDAVGHLMTAIVYVADPVLAAQAAQTMAALPNAKGYVEKYRTTDNEIFQGLTAQPALAALVEQPKD